MSSIQAHEAAISTVTVEIKTLMVSNRQMTLAIYRQLDEGYAFPEPTEWPVRWGRVNYHFPGCCPESPEPRTHVHLIFSLWGRLFRSTVWEDLHPQEVKEARRLPQLFIAG